MRIQVTQEHINNGKKTHVRLCPIALAISAIRPDAHVSVGYNYALINHRYYELPWQAREFASQFDFGHQPLEPFEFEIGPLARLKGWWRHLWL